jgi:hypothetical protein
LGARGLQGADRGDQIIGRLYEFSRLDGEKRHATLDIIAELCDQMHDPTGIGREDGCREIVVDRDITIRDLFPAGICASPRARLRDRPIPPWSV